MSAAEIGFRMVMTLFAVMFAVIFGMIGLVCADTGLPVAAGVFWAGTVIGLVWATWYLWWKWDI